MVTSRHAQRLRASSQPAFVVLLLLLVCSVGVPWGWYRYCVFRYEAFAAHYAAYFVEHLLQESSARLTHWQPLDGLPLAQWRAEPGVIALVALDHAGQFRFPAVPTREEQALQPWLAGLAENGVSQREVLSTDVVRAGVRSRLGSVGIMIDPVLVRKSLLAPHPPWLLMSALNVVAAGLAGWWIQRARVVRLPSPQPSAQGAASLQHGALLQRVADVIPASVLLFNAEWRLCAMNDRVQQQCHPAATVCVGQHVLDVVTALRWGDTMLSLVDRFALTAHQSDYRNGVTVVKWNSAPDNAGYWVMYDADSEHST